MRRALEASGETPDLGIVQKLHESNLALDVIGEDW